MNQRRDATVGGMSDTSNMRSSAEAMTAPTPEQMRGLAGVDLNDDDSPMSIREWQERAADALRAAADQLEAVRCWCDSESDEPNWSALDAILVGESDV